MASFAARRSSRLRTRDAPSDLVISGLHHIEAIGSGLVRLVWFTTVQAESGAIEPAPAEFNTVMPAEAIPDAIGKAIAATSRTVLIKPDGSMLLLQ